MKKMMMVSIMAVLVIAGNALALDMNQVKIHGFISQGYIQTTEHNFFGSTEDGSFEFNEFGINFSKYLTDNLLLGIQLFSRDFGSNGNNEIKIDWAFGDYRWRNWLGIRAGKIKTPKGLYNEFRDIDMLRTFIFLPQSVYPEILRETDIGLLGAGIYGEINLNSGGGLSYQLMYGTQNIDANESVSQAIQGTTAYRTPVENDSIDVDKKYVLGLVWNTPIEGFRLGVTHESSDPVASAHVTMDVPGIFGKGTILVTEFDKFQNTVLSAEYTFRNLLLAGEYIQTKKEFGGGNRNITADGWYLAFSYRFKDRFSLGGYYSESYNNKDDRDGETLTSLNNDIAHRAYFKDFCFTTLFTVNEYWTIKLEGHHFSGTNGVSPLDQEQDDTIFDKEDWFLFAAKVTFSF